MVERVSLLCTLTGRIRLWQSHCSGICRFEWSTWGPGNPLFPKATETTSSSNTNQQQERKPMNGNATSSRNKPPGNSRPINAGHGIQSPAVLPLCDRYRFLFLELISHHQRRIYRWHDTLRTFHSVADVSIARGVAKKKKPQINAFVMYRRNRAIKPNNTRSAGPRMLNGNDGETCYWFGWLPLSTWITWWSRFDFGAAHYVRARQGSSIVTADGHHVKWQNPRPDDGSETFQTAGPQEECDRNASGNSWPDSAWAKWLPFCLISFKKKFRKRKRVPCLGLIALRTTSSPPSGHLNYWLEHAKRKLLPIAPSDAAGKRGRVHCKGNKWTWADKKVAPNATIRTRLRRWSQRHRSTASSSLFGGR